MRRLLRPMIAALGSVLLLSCAEAEPTVLSLMEAPAGTADLCAFMGAVADLEQGCQQVTTGWAEETRAGICRESAEYWLVRTRRSSYVPSRGEGCLSALRSAPCDDLSRVMEISEDCRTLLQGPRRPGEPCTHDGECMLGHRCRAINDCAGVCERVRQEREPCTRPGDCLWGLVCRDKKCVAPSGDGAPCTSDSHCLAGLTCQDAGEGTSETAKNCRPRPSGGARDGEACGTSVTYEICAPGNCCSSQLSAGACKAQATGVCNTGLTPASCSSLKLTCAQTAAAGQPCGPVSSPPIECAEGLSCVSTKCKPLPRQPGEACSVSTGCHPPEHLACEKVDEASAERACKELPGPGAGCKDDSVCRPPFVCSVDVTCVEPQPNGTPCHASSQCQSGVCEPSGYCGTGLDVCSPDRPATASSN